MINKNQVYKFLNCTLNGVSLSTPAYLQIKKAFLELIDHNDEKANQFIEGLKEVKEALNADLEFFYQSDPAATSLEEITLAYPGYKAITFYRIAHNLVNLGYQIEARLISEAVHSLTGIDIHPEAKIGVPFFIDHGTGIVIGQTAVIGKYCKIYQGVTLGALSLSAGQKLKGTKRHPTLGDYVTIYAGSSILGDITIGNDVTIGSNVFLLDSVPDHTKVLISKPELIMKNKEGVQQ